MVTWGQAVFLALLQGFSELFPVSSLGHTVLLPAFLGWAGVESAPTFVPFVVMLHLGTAAALLWFYRQRWGGIIRAFVVSAVRGRLSHAPEEHLAWMLFFGTIPAGVIGAVLEHPLKVLFSTPLVAAVFLILNGLIMLITERLRGRPSRSDEPTSGGQPASKGIKDLTWRDAIAIGSAQALALIPGISRSGVTMCAGLLRRMDHEDAANYTFMLATPIIAAAGLLETPTLVTAGGDVLGLALVGGLLAAAAAYVSVRFLTRYFRFGRLDPFAYYCVLLGCAGLVFVVLHGA